MSEIKTAETLRELAHQCLWKSTNTSLGDEQTSILASFAALFFEVADKWQEFVDRFVLTGTRIPIEIKECCDREITIRDGGKGTDVSV